MNWIHLDDITLRYELAGQGRETMVLLHELGGSLESFDSLTPLLGGSLDVLRYDLRGAGLSEKPRAAFAFDDHVDDLAGLLAALDINAPVHVAGVAAGAALAVSFALRCPQLVRSLALCAPALNVDEERVRYLAQRSELVMRDGMRAVADDTLDRSYPPIVRRDAAAYLSYRGRFLGNDPVGYARNNLAFAQVHLLDRLKELASPCLVLAGAHDLLRPPDKVGVIAQMIPRADYAIADSGHLMPVQAPGEMARHLLDFVAPVEGGVALSHAS
ncbi:alpha/beta hydrolase [Bradyrhizobium sp. CCGUVB1N3]|uniref:alpha/beta fold hydrolase n=1 Tax=Bradyrhizobium sp. CCGUVB1N3 TaxID=2949629 RepID=UPI0020B43925|nr:alpha/beta fold hydrolase [Bradyrhizobium sp. CCGUVB1N3]MCP3473997.1 alpha/beta hydrolase [Bradyrhizobium sp. CCGUVB1N3]